jgi:hypothetical protein
VGGLRVSEILGAQGQVMAHFLREVPFELVAMPPMIQSPQ